MIDIKDVLQVLASGFGAWVAIRVELRWLRADQKRIERIVENHGQRIRAIELRD